jgi:hypothetical protein
MEQLFAIITEIVDNLFSDYNYGKSETKVVMPYCRISVERYTFGKVYPQLYELYKIKNAEHDKQFNERRQSILGKFNIIKIFKSLDIQRKYWLMTAP